MIKEKNRYPPIRDENLANDETPRNDDITEISRGEGMHRRPVKCAPDKHFHFFLCRETSIIYFFNISAKKTSVCENMIILCYYIISAPQQIQTMLTVVSSHSITGVLQGEC